jgi:hypothetical protein
MCDTDYVTDWHVWLQDVVGWREWLEGFRKYFGVLASKVKDDDPVIQSLKLLLCTNTISTFICFFILYYYLFFIY